MLRSEAARGAWARSRRIDQQKLSRALSAEGVRVLRDYTGPTLELGPLQMYQSAFPERYVVWDGLRELWEVRQLNPVSGHDERYELVFWWTAFDPRTGEELDQEVVAQMYARREMGGLVKLYRPFDYAFVHERLREWQEFQSKGARRLAEEVAESNRRRQQEVTAEVADAWDVWQKEDRRWLPVLAQHYDTRRTKRRAYAHERIPQLPVGIDLRQEKPIP